MRSSFEAGIWKLTRPLNGQYPRPWMTDLKDPKQADVFLVGKNQRNGYETEQVGFQGRHVDALFNRNGETCRGLYEEMTQGKTSPTRKNINRFVSQLARVGIAQVLETNVICYSSDMSSDLSRDAHQGGAKLGREIFYFLLQEIQPTVLIAHGASTRDELENILGEDLTPAPNTIDDALSKTRLDGMKDSLTVYCIPSLAPPAFNKWTGWSDAYLSRVAADVASELKARP